MFDPGGFTGRLRACPYLGGWRALRIGWARLDAQWYPRLDRFWLTEDLDTFFPREDQAIHYTVGIAVDRNFPKPGWFGGAVKVRRQEAIETSGINRGQGTPWSEELHSKELH